MLRIRLQRTGRRHQPSYRVVVAERTAPVQGRFLDIVGHVNPSTKERSVDADKVQEWIGKGAKPSPTVHNMLVDLNVIEGPKVTAWRPKRRPENEEEASEDAADAPEQDEAESNDVNAESDDAEQTEEGDDEEDAGSDEGDDGDTEEEQPEDSEQPGDAEETEEETAPEEEAPEDVDN